MKNNFPELLARVKHGDRLSESERNAVRSALESGATGRPSTARRVGSVVLDMLPCPAS